MASDETLSTLTTPSGFRTDATTTTDSDWNQANSTFSDWGVEEAVEEDWRVGWYRSVVPVMIAFCAVSLVTNLSILVSVRWVRRRSLNPTLCLSISLAVADAYASLCLGTGLLVNSLLPVGYDVHWGNACFALSIEALRLAGLAVSTLHLFTMAVNHYLGIVRPLHYASTVTRRAALVAIAIMWTVPLVFFFVYFSSVADDGYQAPHCESHTFLGLLKFRLVVGCIFFLPLALMCFMYVHIFVIVMQHNRGLNEYQKRGSRKPETGNKKQSNSTSFRHNVKAALTTFLILGTYVVSFMPAVLFFVLVCSNCAVRPEQVSQTVMFVVNLINNTLMILKLFLNPMVYAARMKDIRVAMRYMVFSCLPTPVLRCLCGADSQPGQGVVTSHSDGVTFCSFNRSRNDTMLSSIRMHSVAARGRCSQRLNPPTALLVQQKEVTVSGGGGGDNGSLGGTAAVVATGSKDNGHTHNHHRNGSLGSDVTVTTYLTSNTNSTSCVADF